MEDVGRHLKIDKNIDACRVSTSTACDADCHAQALASLFIILRDLLPDASGQAQCFFRGSWPMLDVVRSMTQKTMIDSAAWVEE